MDEKTEKQMAEAFEEAKENPSKENVTVVEAVDTGENSGPTKVENPTEAGLEALDSTKAPAVVSVLPEAEAVDMTIRDETVSEIPEAQNKYPPPAPPRNYEAEWKELADAHPEVVGKEMPDDIVKACMESDKPPLRIYESMMLAKQADEIASLKQEIATLKQNAESASRAPVSAVTGGGAGAEPEDPFIRAFRNY